ncbi:MAG: hypothetical protein OEV61_12260, partial [Chloroflexota bacterium]|nr:hypothetical protein [Chloroflexota bacterium]
MERCKFARPSVSIIAAALTAIALSVNHAPGASAQSANYKKQFSLARSPDDVEFTKRGGIAVVRASQHYPDQIIGPQPSDDLVVVVNPTNGTRILIQPANKCAPFALTQPAGAADLVAASEARAVLIGQRHWTSGAIAGQYTSVNVLDLTDAYGVNGPICIKSWSKAEAGFVSDVDITPDGRFSVVNHRGAISVFRIDGATVPDPVEFGTSGGNPTRQRNSVAMSRIETPGAPVKCVVTTVRDVGGTQRIWAYVLDLAGSAPILDAALEINASNPSENSPGHDLRLTPDETMAVVSADGVIALIDLTVSPAVIRGELSDPNAERNYDNLADSLILTNTQAVVLSSDRGNPSGQWQADVFDISSGP